ncbi:MAG: ZIP family metal transporter [Cyanobacteria bacterium J06648_16]
MNRVVMGLTASLLAGLATAIGAFPILFTTRVTQSRQALMMGFGGGVMLAATSFSLLIPGIEAALNLGATRVSAAFIMSVGILLGGWLLWFANNHLPYERFFQKSADLRQPHWQRTWLFVLAITVHNFPEGLAVGVGFGSGDVANGIALAIGIGLQNIPEGLVVALSLRELKYPASYAFGVSLLTGLVEPIGGLIGAGVVSLAQLLLPWGMAFAAGAMLFVISHEIIPATSRDEINLEGTLGVMVGFIVMMFLDVALG